MQFRIFPVISAVLLVDIVYAWTMNDVGFKNTSEMERIVGGRRARTGQFPWAVALYVDDIFQCTASILSTTTVLTAAHCVEVDGQELSADRFYGIANVNRMAPGQRMEFDRITIHPDYDTHQIHHDIAIMHPTQPIQYRDGVGPVCVARPDTDPMEYGRATAMGWGSVSPSRIFPVYPNTLRYAKQRVIENNECDSKNPGIIQEKICAEGFLSSICSGDSGGPLVHLSRDQPPVQIGIASYINAWVGCTTFGPGVWTRVSHYSDFIIDNSDGTICTI